MKSLTPNKSNWGDQETAGGTQDSEQCARAGAQGQTGRNVALPKGDFKEEPKPRAVIKGGKIAKETFLHLHGKHSRENTTDTEVKLINLSGLPRAKAVAGT